MSDPGTVRGYIVLADISGYTPFVAGTELEHAQGIIEDLMGTLLGCLTPTLTLVKLEGDAAFCHAPADRFSSPQHLLNLIETSYRDFADRLRDMRRMTTCRCRACASIDQLDLKFVAHWGTYLVRNVAGAVDLAGTDVILAHRLLKNSVEESTGLRAYAFLTDECCRELPEIADAMHHAESYEALGTVEGRVFDLHSAVERLRAERRAFITAEDADMELTFEVSVPPSVAWAAFTDGGMTPRWSASTRSQVDHPNRDGRIGLDSERHCDHGSWTSAATFVDWQPHSYFTLRRRPIKRAWNAPPRMLEMTMFEPGDDGGTRVTMRMRCEDRGLRTMLPVRIFWPIVRRSMVKEQARLETFLRETYLESPEVS